MDPFDPAITNTVSNGWKPLLTLIILSCFGSFFLGALVTAIKRGVKEEGWFQPRKGSED